MADQEPRQQSVTNAWVQALKNEVYRARSKDVAAVARVGFMMATFANADGGSITAGQDRLAVLTGSSQETVSRAIRVLVALGVMECKRRPNKASEYRLLSPRGERLDWSGCMPLYTETRQRRRKDAIKRAEIDALLGPPEPVPGGVPEPVPDRGPEPVAERCPEPLEPVPERGRNPLRNGFRNPFPAGGTYPYLPTVVTSPEDQDTVAHSPQPQVGVGGRVDEIDSTGDKRWTGEATCSICGRPMAGRAGRTAHVGCQAAA